MCIVTPLSLRVMGSEAQIRIGSGKNQEICFWAVVYGEREVDCQAKYAPEGISISMIRCYQYAGKQNAWR